MSISGLQNIPSRAASVSDPKKKPMGKNDFLKMLVAQLQGQDPLNPMDSTGFTAQLAQFSSLEQLQNINSSLSSMKSAQDAAANARAVDFIGKEISATGDQFEITNGNEAVLSYKLEQDAASVYMKIYDQDGNFIQDLELGMQASGLHSVTWDGKNYQGRPMQTGRYSFQIMAVDQQGQAVASQTFTSGIVNGVDFDQGRAYLLVDGQKVPLAAVVQVSEKQT